MKMKLFFRISVLVLCILMSLSSFADDKKDRISVEDIEWSANNQRLDDIVSTPADPKKIYLYATTPNKFVTVGGRYGAQPIFAEVGMNFYVEKIADDADNRYYIHSWVNNPTTAQGDGNADYLGVEPLMDTDQRIFLTKPETDEMKSIYLYVDRGKLNTHDDNTHSSPDRIKWYIKYVEGTKNGYQIYSKWKDNQGGYNDEVERKYYLSYYEAKEVKPQKKFLVVTTDVSKAETFYFINIDNYHKVINSQTTKYINVSGLVQDARFERNNKGIKGYLYGDYDTDSKNNVWQFRYNRSEDAYFFPSLQDNVEDLAYMTAWVGPKGSSSENQNGNYLIQKITGLKPGLYRVNCQGFYFNPGDKDDKDNTSFVFASQDYKDISNQTALKTILPEDWELMQNMTYSKPYPTAKQWNKDVVGWNLGNQFECSAPNQDGESEDIGNPDGSIHAEEAWGNPVVTEAMIQAVKNAGFNAIRIPIRWQCHITNDQTMSIDEAWIKRIKEVVDWCLKNDLKVIINAHHEKWLENNPTDEYKDKNCKKLALLWTNIASAFANYDSRLAFAGTNEVHISGYWGKPEHKNLAVQNAYNQKFVEAVRATGGNNAQRHLIVQTYACDPWFGIENGDFIIPKDLDGNGNNYMSVEFHYYQPWSYAGNPDGVHYDYWGDAYKDAGTTPTENENSMKKFFDDVVNTWSNKGLGIVIGEWGVTNRNTSNPDKVHANMTYYSNFLTTEARTRGFSTFVWDNNQFSNDNGRENYGIFDRHNGMKVNAPWILNGIFGTESGYKQTDGLNGSKQTDGVNGYKDYSVMHCVNAGKIFAASNPYEDKDVDSRKYDSSVAVLVKADEGSKMGTLYIGAGKRANKGGYAFFDNFQLFYMGDKEWYLDATNTSESEFTTTKNDNDNYHTPSGINHNPDQYKFPVTYNIRRYFHKDQWESLILPCSLTGDQVKQTFGGDQGVKLSVFDKVEGTCVKFRAVDLDKEGIVAGQPYIIKVGKMADIESQKEYTFPWGNDITVKVKGPIYQVKGVVPPTFTGDSVKIVRETFGYNVQFHGFYYDPGSAPAKAYVVNNGNMYHLTSAWNSFVGTSWYVTITDADGHAKALSFSFDGDSSTTAIENVTRQEDAAVQTDGFVYNLSGQRVGTRNNMSNLSSGIYIVAGKKVVVK